MALKNKKPLRLLFVEDLESDQMLAEREIRKQGVEFISIRVDYEERFRKEIREFYPDVIVSDFAMPAFDGMAALKVALEMAPGIPFIILTGSMNEEVAVECMKAGADDYILKENLKRLVPAIEAAITKKENLISRERAEEALRQSEEQFRKLFENHSAVHLLIDPETGNIVNANKAASKFYGWSIEQLKHMNISQINTLTGEKTDKVISTALRKNKHILEFQHKTANGSILDVEVYSSKVELNGKDHLYSIVHNVTEKKQLFREMVLAKEKAEESDRLKSAFLANMSHEIRTPLNGILGFTSLLTTEEELPEAKKAEFFKIINQCTDNLLHIINDILDISKLETGQLIMNRKPFDLNESLRRLHTLYLKKLSECGKEHVKLNLLSREREIIIHADEHRLIQVFMNLLDNAIKFTAKGNINFGVSEIHEGNIICIVSDTGIGIPKESQAFIFDRFSQADDEIAINYGGTGLGLSIVKKLIEMMDGKISVESDSGKGAAFQFLLPYNDEIRLIKADENKTVSFQPKKNIKILLVEDDKTSQIYYEVILNKLDVELSIAETGEDALFNVRENNPDIILMDIRLPDCNGLDIVKEIRKTNKKVKIIVQTAYAMASDEEKSLEAGCNDFLSKPVKVSELLRMIKNV